MANSKITMLNELDVLNDNILLKVRVVRCTTRPQFNDSTKVYCYDLILMDDEGSKIEANALHRFCKDYCQLLKERSAIMIGRPTLAANSYNFRLYQTKYKVSFNNNTVVAPCKDFDGDMFGFSFANFKSIHDGDFQEGSTIDVVGAIVRYHNIQHMDMAGGKPLKRLALDLQDLDGITLNVTLWDDYADQCSTYLNQAKHDHNVVLIIQFGKYKLFNGKPQVSNCYHVTKLFINSDIDDVNDFKTRFLAATSTQSSSSQSGFSSPVNCSLKDEFLKNYIFYNIRDIPSIQKAGFIVITGEIKGHSTEGSWYYSGCSKCKTKIEKKVICTLKEDGSGEFDETTILECKGKSCGNNILPQSRFKVPVCVQDGTGSVWLTMFDRDARELLKVSATQLLQRNDELAIDGNFPVELDSLVGKKYAFKICISDYNIRNGKEYYSISKLTDSDEILIELEKKSDAIQDIVNASLCSSYLWNKCKLRKLTKNMRLNAGIDSDDIKRTENFAKWLLDIGEGKFGGTNDGEAIVDIPDDFLIKDSSDPISALIEFVYPCVLQNFNVTGYFSERAILAPKNEVVHEINDRLLDIFPGEVKEYLSSDSICQSEFLNDRLESSVYSPDVLNGLKISGLPNHRLLLKVGVPIMLLRNIDQQAGLCNGTRLRVIQLGQRVIEAEVISGTNTGTRTFIPRINIIPSDKKIPFKFQRRQFPISVCFAMTINKSQGQTLSKVGLYLKEPVFSHGQLYVALSRVKTKDGIKLLLLDGKGEVTNQTTNVVYKEIFANL